MLDSFSSTDDEYFKKLQYKSSSLSFHNDVVTSISDLESSNKALESSNKALDSELEAIKLKLESVSEETQEQLKALDKSLVEIRDMARDAKHISVGVDGRNGLRGAIQNLSTDVSKITSELNTLGHAAHSYNELRVFLSKLFIASITAMVIQFAGVVWYLSAQHSKQESLRTDLNRVIAHIDKQQETRK